MCHAWRISLWSKVARNTRPVGPRLARVRDKGDSLDVQRISETAYKFPRPQRRQWTRGEMLSPVFESRGASSLDLQVLLGESLALLHVEAPVVDRALAGARSRVLHEEHEPARLRGEILLVVGVRIE